MEHGLSWFVAWQSIVPIVMGIFSIVMVKWLSNYYTEMASKRTVRVVSQLGAARRGSGAFRR
jgi:hypothetical protein